MPALNPLTRAGQALVIASVAIGAALIGAGSTGLRTIHCSVSTEPLDDAVVQGLGVLFGILIVFRMWRARKNAARDRRDSEPTGRLPYRDIGLRESLASFSDDR